MKLYQLPACFAEIELLASDGELTPDLEAKLDALEMELSTKLDSCCRVLRSLEARAAAYKAEADRMYDGAAKAETSAWRLKEYMQRTLEALGIERQDTELFRLRIAKNPPSVKFDGDPRELPIVYQRVTVEADKKRLLDAHKGHMTLPPGVSIQQTKSLRIS